MKNQHIPQRIVSLLCFFLTLTTILTAQPVLETGGTKMPDEWIDRHTGHKVMKLTRRPGNNMSFYFHNRPFAGNKMVFYGTDYLNTAKNDSVKQETGNIPAQNKQLYSVDLTTLEVKQLTSKSTPMNGEIVAPENQLVYYQSQDSVFATHIESGATRLVYVFPENFKGNITTINSNETLLAGAWSSPREKDILKNNPTKASFFNLIYEAREPRTLFTLDVRTGDLQKVLTDSAWLNHVQFSPKDPSLLMFCHEGPWHKVNRIWTIDVTSRDIALVHRRTMDMEIAGHEWFGPDGHTIWYDLQQPRGETFFVAGANVKDNSRKKYSVERNEWSIHFNLSPDQKLFCGDGGDPRQVAKAEDGQWIYLFEPDGDRLKSTRLVNMQHHNYRLEPNVHFSPDGQWVIFRANFEGHTDVYAVNIVKEKP